MKCFTVLNLGAPYPGIVVARNFRTGMKADFCFVADGVEFAPPQYYRPLPSLYCPTPVDVMAVISNATAVDARLGYPILVAPSDKDPTTAMVFLAMNQYENGENYLGRQIKGESHTGKAVIIDETSISYPWAELLISIPVGAKQVIFFDRGHVALSWNGTEVIVSRE